MAIKTKYKTPIEFKDKSDEYKLTIQNKPTLRGYYVHMGILPHDIKNMNRYIKDKTLTKEQITYWEDIQEIVAFKRQEIFAVLEGRMTYPPEKVNVGGIIRYLSAVDKETYANKENEKEQVIVNVSLENESKNKI